LLTATFIHKKLHKRLDHLKQVTLIAKDHHRAAGGKFLIADGLLKMARPDHLTGGTTHLHSGHIGRTDALQKILQLRTEGHFINSGTLAVATNAHMVEVLSTGQKI